MYASGGRHSRTDVVSMLIATFDTHDVSKFGPVGEEKGYSKKREALSKEDVLKIIKEDISLAGEDVSSLSNVHPAWIAKALENESPKVIGIILRWLPSSHVRYILEHLPKKIKMSLPKLVESFSVPTEIMNFIKNRFERKFRFLSPADAVVAGGHIHSFDEIINMNPNDLETLFRDLGLHELAMAFQSVESGSLRVLLNRMSVPNARALQQRMKDIEDTNEALLKDARYTVLESAMDQEDADRLLVELGMASFSKAMKDKSIFSILQLKLEPMAAYILKRYIDQHVGVNRLDDERQALVMERVALLMRAGEIGG